MYKKLNRTSAGKPLDYPVKVLQFGKGNFLRGFADWMVDILNERHHFNGAIQVVQVNARTTDKDFEGQEGLYHVVLRGLQIGQPFEETRLISCVAGVLNPFTDYHAYLRAGENSDLRFVVSNTTEAGIEFREEDRTPENMPSTFPGKLTALLYHRFRFFNGDPSKALVILPCELIENNGEALRTCVVKYADHWNLGEAFKSWITEYTLFCNTLVDRIVPGFPKADAEGIWKATGFEDRLIVTAEPFHLWVIQPLLRPGMTVEKLELEFPLVKAGFQVKFTGDLAPYRTTKVRILNGSHTAMVPIGYLRGLRTVKEVIDNGFTGEFVRRAIEEEIIPTLDLPREELDRFAADTIERFRNPFIRHELKSIALNSVSKYKVRVLPTVMEYIRRKGELPQLLLQSLAALILYYKGSWRGEPTPVNDAPSVLDFFREAWKSGDPNEVADKVLSRQDFWGTELTRVDGLRNAVQKHIEGMRQWEQ